MEVFAKVSEDPPYAIRDIAVNAHAYALRHQCNIGFWR